MKILYAASNNENAKIQLSRFLKATQDSTNQIKIAAYKVSSPTNTNIDWTLDALLNIYRPELLTLNNDNFNIYFDQIKSFNPDLIISDLEYFTSIVANDLNIPIWQCSSSAINYALRRKDKYGLGLFKFHAHSVSRETIHTQRIINILDNSQRNFVYSHYGDMDLSPVLESSFSWVRPYHKVTKEHVPCQHYLTAALVNLNKRIINTLKKYPDSVVFSQNPVENYDNPRIKDIRIEDEYYCNLKNSKIYVCQGQTSFLADAFYNGKYALIFTDYEDTESIINSQLAQKMGVGQIVSHTDDLSSFASKMMQPSKSEAIKYLHEHIEEI